ncbi:MAG: hypothetical protein ACTHVE_08860 [Senegalia sp. (in: firmicutes)]|uniref:hypothetical protein n=1 Tax=Senegalia sp. (in: firmicutes) TaxID=1924098 RepID=UPI003F95839B
MKDKKEKIEWKRLDNASKIFPATSNNKDTKVYRISAELYDDINPKNLQKALDLTIESFPIYKSILRRGFFWYYFELSNISPKVEIETTNPCAALYIEGKRNLLFRVSYYKRKINFELFHALSDGAGAIWFLETLIFHYMKYNYKDELDGFIPDFEYGASISQKMDDSFFRNYSPNIKVKNIGINKYKTAYKIKGKRIDENKMKVIEGSMYADELLNISREYGSSITVFLSSLLIYSIYLDMPKNKRKKQVVISVPINLRGYYKSATARNFFTTMNISYDFQNNSSEFKDIIRYVDEKFKKELEEENIQLKLARFMKFENNPLARIIPLSIKDVFMKIADKLNDRRITSSISNIGKIKVDSKFEGYIRQFSICVSARTPKITFCSYNDRFVITFTSPYIETDIQRLFFQFLSDRNIKIKITSNM